MTTSLGWREKLSVYGHHRPASHCPDEGRSQDTVDETYTRLQGRWTYIYRAIDQDGQVVDAYVSERRNAEAAQAFFERSLDETRVTPV